MQDAVSPGAEGIGQAGAAPDTGTTVAAPTREATGQAQGTPQTSAPEQGQAAATDDFFDPKNLPDDPEVQKAYAQMRKAWTQKMQEASARMTDAERYQQAVQFLQRDPQSFLSEIAKQHGFSIVKGAAEAAAQNGEDWTPQTWQEVIAKSKEAAKAELLAELQPVLQEVHKSKAASFERVLDDTDPMWRQYEKDFRANLMQFPQLSEDPKKLFKLSMPDDYVMSKATAAALAKVKGQTEAVKMSSGSTTRAAAPTQPKVNSFDEAVAAAKQMLAAGKGFI